MQTFIQILFVSLVTDGGHLARLGVRAVGLPACALLELAMVGLDGAAGLQLVERVHRRLLARKVLDEIDAALSSVPELERVVLRFYDEVNEVMMKDPEFQEV